MKSITSFLLLFPLTIYSQQRDSVDINEVRSVGGLIYKIGSEKPYTGLVTSRSEILLAETGKVVGYALDKDNYLNGVQNGLSIELWNGHKFREVYYVNGKKEGIETGWWYEIGKKQYEGRYVNGDKEGLWTEWYENGQKSREVTYVGSFENGIEITWYENGMQMREGRYVDSSREGIWTWWFDNGQKQIEGEFINDNKNGIWIEWGNDGLMLNTKKYVDGNEVSVK